MIRRIFVTLGALLLVNAAAANPSTNAIRVGISQPLDLRSAHVFLGIAVLGHHVGRLEDGWLVKQTAPGFLHIDWNRRGDWAGLVRTVQGPRDISQSQLDAVIRVVEEMGYPASAIRAWRVPAPVGYDGFNEGDKVLTIGEILVDLGTVDDARLALERWSDAAMKSNDPFEQLPQTNVRYAYGLYFQPDCRAMEERLRKSALVQAGPIAQAAASHGGTRAAFSAYDATIPSAILCPNDAKPNFYNVSAGPPSGIEDVHPVMEQHSTVTYALSGSVAQQPMTVLPDDLSGADMRWARALGQPYVQTAGTATIKWDPDAVILRFAYPLGEKARTGYQADLRDAQTHIAALQRMVQPVDILVQRFAAEDHDDEIDAFVLVRAKNLGTVKDLAKAADAAGSDNATYTEFVSNCDELNKNAVRLAFLQSKRKSQMLAKMLHASVGALLKVSVEDPMSGNAVCAYDARAPLTELALQVTRENSTQLTAFGHDQANAQIETAFALEGIARPNTPLVRQEYKSDVRGTGPEDALKNRALIQAAREAIVDNPHIVSVSEIEATIWNQLDGTKQADGGVLVLRPSANTP